MLKVDDLLNEYSNVTKIILVNDRNNRATNTIKQVSFNKVTEVPDSYRNKVVVNFGVIGNLLEILFEE